MSRAKREHFTARQKNTPKHHALCPKMGDYHGHDLPAALTHVLTLTSSPEWMMPSSPMTPAISRKPLPTPLHLLKADIRIARRGSCDLTQLAQAGDFWAGPVHTMG